VRFPTFHGQKNTSLFFLFFFSSQFRALSVYRDAPTPIKNTAKVLLILTFASSSTYSWDSLYATELANHAENPSDIGTVWFDDAQAEEKILAFLAARSDIDPATASVLDLGCGNGSLLKRLHEPNEDEDDDYDDDDDEDYHDSQTKQKTRKPWTGRLLGIDYSPASIKLARRIHASTPISFETWDVLRGPYAPILTGNQEPGWDVVLDKGTFDAICLSDERDAAGRRVCEDYPARVRRLVKIGGLLLITSCNWTEPELKEWFTKKDFSAENEGDAFIFDARVEYPSFRFGGVEGQKISTLCFRRVSFESK
jgi:SAM-dependent methyltransferase